MNVKVDKRNKHCVLDLNTIDSFLLFPILLHISTTNSTKHSIKTVRYAHAHLHSTKVS